MSDFSIINKLGKLTSIDPKKFISVLQKLCGTTGKTGKS